MTAEYKEGAIVQVSHQPAWGPGKIVHVSGDRIHIIFRDENGRDARVFKLGAPALTLAAIQHDPVLDNLPPLAEKDGRWRLPKERLQFETAVRTFLRHFPAGFCDQNYTTIERKGKDEAHRQFLEQLGTERMHEMLEADDVPELTRRLLAVKNSVNELLAPFENMAIHEALKDNDAARRFFSTLLAVLDSAEIDPDVYTSYLDAVSSLPARRARVSSWPIATLFPHIAQPDRHMFLKPESTKKAADALAFDLQYSSTLNWPTYAALLRMGRAYLDRLTCRGAKDLVDVQSFIFVAGGGYDT